MRFAWFSEKAVDSVGGFLCTLRDGTRVLAWGVDQSPYREDMPNAAWDDLVCLGEVNESIPFIRVECGRLTLNQSDASGRREAWMVLNHRPDPRPLLPAPPVYVPPPRPAFSPAAGNKDASDAS